MDKKSEEAYLKCINNTILVSKSAMKYKNDSEFALTYIRNIMILLARDLLEIAYHEKIEDDKVNEMIDKYHLQNALKEMELGIRREVKMDGTEWVDTKIFANDKEIDRETYQKLMKS
jgi:hypothetical protein